MISLIQLEYIVAVDTYRHFVTASEKCFVTQPTLSMQIKKLEKELEVVVFDRTKQPIIPTPIGEQIIAQARRTLAESKKIQEIVDEFSGSISGEISIGIIPSLAPYLLPLFIGKFTKKYPQVNVKVSEMLTDKIIDYLKNDRIDVGLLVTPLHEKGIIEQPLFYEEMILYVNKNHALASQQEIHTNELSSPDLWLLSDGHCFRSQVINLCTNRANQKNNMGFEYASGSLETIKKIVEIEGGFTMLPELAVDRGLKDTNVVIRHFDDTTPLREVSLVYSRNYVKKRLLDLLSAEIKDVIPPHMLSNKRGQVVEWR